MFTCLCAARCIVGVKIEGDFHLQIFFYVDIPPNIRLKYKKPQCSNSDALADVLNGSKHYLVSTARILVHFMGEWKYILTWQLCFRVRHLAKSSREVYSIFGGVMGGYFFPKRAVNGEQKWKDITQKYSCSLFIRSMNKFSFPSKGSF